MMNLIIKDLISTHSHTRQPLDAGKFDAKTTVKNERAASNWDERTRSNRVRVELEPLDIWLDEKDDSLSLVALQSAFPGCSGLYYRIGSDGGDDYGSVGDVTLNDDKMYNKPSHHNIHNNEKRSSVGHNVYESANDKQRGGVGSKCAVKFDGRKFFPPKRQKRLFVTLGSSALKFPVQSYENATKQFQQSVALVQSMLRTAVSEPDFAFARNKRDPRTQKFKGSNYSDDSGAELLSHNNNNAADSVDLTTSVTVKNESSAELRAQFAELSQICVGKDAIVADYRMRNVELQSKIDELNTMLNESTQKSCDAHGKCVQLEDELELYRTMSKEQDVMCAEINSLVKKLADLKRQSELKIAILDSSVEQRNQRIQELTKRADAFMTEICGLREALREQKKQNDEMRHNHAQAEAQFKAKLVECSEQNALNASLHDELLRDSTALHERNSYLTQKIEQLRSLNAEAAKECLNILKRNLSPAVNIDDTKILEEFHYHLTKNDAIEDGSKIADTMEKRDAKGMEISLKDQLFSYVL